RDAARPGHRGGRRRAGGAVDRQPGVHDLTVVERAVPGPGQESVWDYPRPPSLEQTGRHVVVELGGAVIAESRRAWRVCETSHPPVYYVPLPDVVAGVLRPSAGGSFCEWKGPATYWNVEAGGICEPDAAWS